MHVNARSISNLSDLAAALEEPADYYVFDVDHHAIPGEYADFAGTKIVIDGREVARANADIEAAFRLPASAHLA